MFLSLDIETTGLCPTRCQIIQIGGVLHTDWDKPIDELPSFEFVVNHGELRIQPGAFVMNKALIEESLCGKQTIWFGNAIRHIKQWLDDQIDGFDGKITLAGKNLGSFDLQFLKHLPEFDILDFGHRFLDPGMLYFNPLTDHKPPSLQECLRRAGLPGTVGHTAKADALDVIKVLRAAYGYLSPDRITVKQAIEATEERLAALRRLDAGQGIPLYNVMAEIRARVQA